MRSRSLLALGFLKKQQTKKKKELARLDRGQEKEKLKVTRLKEHVTSHNALGGWVGGVNSRLKCVSASFSVSQKQTF